MTTVKIALEQAENLEEINEIKTELEDTGYLVAKRKKSIDKDHKKKSITISYVLSHLMVLKYSSEKTTSKMTI